MLGSYFQLPLINNVAISSHLSYFVQCRMSFVFSSKGSTSQLWNLYARMLKLSRYVLFASIDTIYKFCLCLGDLVKCM